MNLVQANQDRWLKCQIKPSKQDAFDRVAKRLTASDAVARYKKVEILTGVPWWFIAVVHEREASQSWKASIAQGDPWNKRSVHVPAGRGPFKSWEEAAVDALVKCPPYAARNKDWSPGAALALLEKYNGLGYANKGQPSPYIWAGTNQYIKGKYIADGKYDPNTVDQQLGCAGLLMKMDVFESKVQPEHAAAAIGSVGFLAGAWEVVQQHPYIYGVLAVAVGLVIFAIIRKLRGK